MYKDFDNDNESSRWVDVIQRVIEDLGGTVSLEQINLEIPKARTHLSATWRDTVRRTIYEHCSETATYQNRSGKPEDLFFSVGGIGSGIWGLRRFVRVTPEAIDVDPGTSWSEGESAPRHLQQNTYRILRDTQVARQLKFLYENRCQICNLALEISPGVSYSEAHHIIPLGKNKGPHVPGNILVLCPNHHALCDYGAIRLDVRELTVKPGHDLAAASIQFHNSEILKNIV